eukprot:m.34849 g.34849  ORF g.34849 m.34849 type:complete len:436 (-) comp8789_c1_seq1:805-2112(-)
MDAGAIDKLRAFIDMCKSNPVILHTPQLSFFKEYIESLGGKVPEPPKQEEKKPDPPAEEQPPAEEKAEKQAPEEDEEDLDTEEPEIEYEELIIPGVEGLEEEDVSKMEMGDQHKSPSDADQEKSTEMMGKGREAMGNGAFGDAVEALTAAIAADATGTRVFTLRAKCNLKLKKPKACVRDCNAALDRNPDSAAAFKFRGQAEAMLGQWQEAYQDLCKAQNIDFDDNIAETLPEIKANANKIKEHKRKYEILVEERARREKIRMRKKAQRDYKRSKAEDSCGGCSDPGCGAGNTGTSSGSGGAEFGGMPGAQGGGFPGGVDPSSFMTDPDIAEALQDPEVMAALMDMQSNPANIMKHMSNPKVWAKLQKVIGKMGGGMGMPGGMGGMPGGMGGMPGGMGGMGGMGGFPGAPPAAEPEPVPETQGSTGSAAFVDDID